MVMLGHFVASYLVSSCRRVLISQMGLVAVMAVKPGEFRGRQRFRHWQRNVEEQNLHQLHGKTLYGFTRAVREHFTKQDQRVVAWADLRLNFVFFFFLKIH